MRLLHQNKLPDCLDRWINCSFKKMGCMFSATLFFTPSMLSAVMTVDEHTLNRSAQQPVSLNFAYNCEIMLSVDWFTSKKCSSNASHAGIQLYLEIMLENKNPSCLLKTIFILRTNKLPHNVRTHLAVQFSSWVMLCLYVLTHCCHVFVYSLTFLLCQYCGSLGCSLLGSSCKNLVVLYFWL